MQEGAVLATGFEAEGLELRCNEEGGDVLVACGGAAAVKLIVGKKVHVCMNFLLKHRRCRLSGCFVEWMRFLREDGGG